MGEVIRRKKTGHWSEKVDIEAKKVDIENIKSDIGE